MISDCLIGDVMRERGYPVHIFEQHAADLSVDHPFVVQNYRVAHEIVMRHRQDRARTEELRLTLRRYRSFFQQLLSI